MRRATSTRKRPARSRADPDKGKGEKEKEKAEAEAKAEAARAANPNNKAGLINGTKEPVSPLQRGPCSSASANAARELDNRMRELEMREALLGTAEKKLDGRLGDLKTMEERSHPARRPTPTRPRRSRTSSSCTRR